MESSHNNDRLVTVNVGGKRHALLFPATRSTDYFWPESRVWPYTRAEIDAIAACEEPILLTGETGTGKELLAGYLHQKSPRAKGPFISVNCAMFSPDRMQGDLFGWKRGAFSGALADHPGPIAEAEGGTLFLDEISYLTVPQQGHLLRFLQSHEYQPLGEKMQRGTARVLAATSKPEALIEDLKHRFGFTIKLPPLRERIEDVLQLILLPGFIDRQQFTGISMKTICRLIADDWPGNIRELARFCREQSLLAPARPMRDEYERHIFHEPLAGANDQVAWYCLWVFIAELFVSQLRRHPRILKEHPNDANALALLTSLAEDSTKEVISIERLRRMFLPEERGRFGVYDFVLLNEWLGRHYGPLHCFHRHEIRCRTMPEAVVILRSLFMRFNEVLKPTEQPYILEDEKDILDAIHKAASANLLDTPGAPAKRITISPDKVRKFSIETVERVIVLANVGKGPQQIQNCMPETNLSISQIRGIIRTHGDQTANRPKSRGGRPPKKTRA